MMARSTTRSNLRPDTLMQDRRRQFDEIFLQRTAGPYMWVKLRRTQLEQMSSELPLKADIARYSRQVSKVPKAEVAASFDHLVGQSKERRRYFDANCAGGLQIDRERQPRGS